ncbi:Sensor histidine kinase YycG [Slackia heliotrinireducens]|uniref:Sensor-like histidine kinase SenX3 n=1 Tax=Slackia heliotrinireducens (strain ATCC 29202 / DSM 20476 / NCTC 11029 / RHS 1) TaxID=471855 RepID=C7N3P2_SLAHD|nr:HAMP domain-containing sensor histidine kinase [Slackia heliotrinireducens]ACV21633.1 signal transduction histidine kinase [Slackia heliotrinireducens DSM 20476]VEG99208.1 Sensor histidine kinase YycG [Slackia heliotrinireducens]
MTSNGAEKNVQGQALRRSLYVTLAAWTALYILVFLAAVAYFEFSEKGEVAEMIAARTSTYYVLKEDEAEDYLETLDVPRGNFQTVSSNDGEVVVRDLTTYYFIRSLKWPIAVAVFFIGYVVVVCLLITRSVGYFNELSEALAGVVRHRDQPVRLSRELAVIQGELNEVREAALADERAAGEAERRKNELVAYLAHDIRTPLTSVVGYLSLMNEAPDLPDEQRKRYVSAALAKAELLDTLTAEFFEITRYNLATIPIERTDVGVRLFLEQIAEEFLPEMQRRSITSRVDALEDAEIRIDPDKMARAIGNVVRNAVAYADDGSEVVLSARRADDAGWEIVVSDQGREIAPEHLESIFDRFYREDNARSSSGNAGLGLAIAKEIVEAHGGSIRAESADGTTRFIILLP